MGEEVGYTPPDGEQGAVALNSDGSVTFTDDDGSMAIFAPDGRVTSQTAAGDDKKPANLQYDYGTSSPERLTAIKDPVSGRQVTLHYNRTGDECYTGNPVRPAGADSNAPPYMLCQIDYPDGSRTHLWYAGGRLARLDDPGAEVTDFGYDSFTGLLDKIRDPLVADWVAKDPATRDTAETWTEIRYGTDEDDDPLLPHKVKSVTSPAPAPGKPRPGRSYRYVSGSETQVDVAGLSLPGGFARRVTFDAALRSLTDTNATGQTTTATWRPNDLPIATRDAAGRVSTTVYDALDRPVAQYGPAPASCFTDGMKTAVLADNPKAYWRLGETAGPQAADTSGNGRTATYVNTTLGVAGAVPADSNGAAYFNGNNSYLNLPDVLHGTAAPTVELWFNTTGTGALFSYQDAAHPQLPTGHVPALYIGVDGLLRGAFWPGGVTPLQSPTPVSDGAWHHAALVATGTGSGSVQRLYLTGALVGEQAATIDYLTMNQAAVGTGSTHGWPSGTSATQHFFAGSIDEVAVYPSALSAERISAHYSAGLTPAAACANTVPITRTSYDEGIKGLAATYWNNMHLTGPPVGHGTGMTPADGSLHGDWPGSPAAGVNADQWSARWTGYINLDKLGTYSFTLAGDDAARIWIDDQYVAGGWHGTGIYGGPTGTFTNTAPGWKRIRIEYFEINLTATFDVAWTPPGGARTTIPGSVVLPGYGLVTSTTTEDSGGAAPSQTSATVYADPYLGVPTETIDDPNGLNLRNRTGYETQGAGYLRRTSRTLPAGTSDAYAYYGDKETRDIPCPGAATGVNQAACQRPAPAPPRRTGRGSSQRSSTTHRCVRRPPAPTSATGPAPPTTRADGPPRSPTRPRTGSRPVRSPATTRWAATHSCPR